MTDSLGIRLTVGTVILLLIATAVRLTTVNVALLRAEQEIRSQRTNVPPFGDLAGVRADGSQWSSRSRGQELVVLVPLTASHALSEIAFWSKVAALSQAAIPPLQVVGVCDDTGGCASSHGDMTILSFMDPYQMLAVSNAQQRRTALVYQGNRLKGELSISGDARVVAGNIVAMAR